VLADEEDAASGGVVDEIARRVLLIGGRVLAVRRDDLREPAGGGDPRPPAVSTH
jgi:hypothetical protein